MLGFLTANRALTDIPLPVVHTWGDLQNAHPVTTQPATGVKRGEVASPAATFRVGIDTDHVTTYGAVVLYFLGSTGSKRTYTPEQWGDYWLQIDGKKQPEGDVTLSSAADPNLKPPVGTLFFVQAISFVSAGDHVLELIKPPNKALGWTPSATDKAVIDPAKPEVLAHARIHVRGEPDAMWYPFWNTQSAIGGGAPSGRDEMGDVYAIVPVTNPKGDPSVPTPPPAQLFANVPPPDFPLPHLFSHEPPGTHVHLEMKDGTLVARFDSQIIGFFPDDYFLTRWWVNGKQVGLDRAASRPGQMRLLLHLGEPHSPFQRAAFSEVERLPSLLAGSIEWFTHQVYFEMTFKPEWLGAKKGDRIGVQILFCPQGFAPLRGNRPQGFMVEPPRNGPPLPPSNFSQASNKIEFTYSGDPLHPQQ
jgi:hypothetical protein